MVNRRIRALVRGHVQGVNYRWHTRQKADQFGLVGSVRNLKSRNVLVIAEGPERDLEQLVHWLQSGPPSARVESVEVEWMEPNDEFDSFSIRYW